MLEYGKDTGPPETYRIILAVSVALLVHTLLMVTFPFELPEHRHNPVTVSVQLTPRGSTPTSSSKASESSFSEIATPFSIEQSQPMKQATNSLTTPANQPRAVPEPTPPSPGDSVSQPQPPEQASSSASANNPASAPSVAGEQATIREDDQPEDFTMKSEKPTEEAEYKAQLARKIGEQGVISKRVARQLGQKRGEITSVEIELKLLGNGTLVDAKITKSSGNRPLDQVIYKAALGASPYPEPPPSLTSKRWFRVELHFKDT